MNPTRLRWPTPRVYRARMNRPAALALVLLLAACGGSDDEPTTAPAPAPSVAMTGEPTYDSCGAASAAGAGPLRRGEPGYNADLDRDGNGIACEQSTESAGEEPSADEGPAEDPTDEPPAEVSAADLDTAAIQAFLRETYSDTPWIDSIVNIDNASGAAFVETSLPPDSLDGPEICTAVSAYFFSDAYSGDPREDWPGIRVAAVTGERLSFRPSLGDEC